MKIVFKESAARQLRKLEASVRVRILKKLQFYSSQQNPPTFAEPLTDSRFGDRKFRIGDYRVLFDIEAGKIIILRIGHRKDIYR